MIYYLTKWSYNFDLIHSAVVWIFVHRSWMFSVLQVRCCHSMGCKAPAAVTLRNVRADPSPRSVWSDHARSFPETEFNSTCSSRIPRHCCTETQVPGQGQYTDNILRKCTRNIHARNVHKESWNVQSHRGGMFFVFRAGNSVCVWIWMTSTWNWFLMRRNNEWRDWSLLMSMRLDAEMCVGFLVLCLGQNRHARGATVTQAF